MIHDDCDLWKTMEDELYALVEGEFVLSGDKDNRLYYARMFLHNARQAIKRRELKSGEISLNKGVSECRSRSARR